jgi:hypothetical protein
VGSHTPADGVPKGDLVGVLSPDGHFRGSPSLNRELVHVVQTDAKSNKLWSEIAVFPRFDILAMVFVDSYITCMDSIRLHIWLAERCPTGKWKRRTKEKTKRPGPGFAGGLP